MGTDALAANLLIDRHQVERVWAADITFIPTFEGWLYVSAVMNVRSRRIIGISMSEQLVSGAYGSLKDAVRRQKPPEGLIHHSDRGRQSASYVYQDLLKRYGKKPQGKLFPAGNPIVTFIDGRRERQPKPALRKVNTKFTVSSFRNCKL